MTAEDPTHRSHRGLAAAFAVCAVATATVLANHPGGGGGSFADSLKAEARNQLSDAVVHGGFIVTQCVLIVCFVLWSRLLGSARVAVVVGMVAFCVGCGALIASMILDGFVSPALAVRFVGTDSPDNLVMARTLLVFCGTSIRFLIPLGIAFQSVAMLSWSSALLTRSAGRRRAVGIFGSVCAVVLIVALLAAPAKLMTHVLLAGIGVLALWYLGLAGILCATQKKLRDDALPRTA
jgi:hypothetical protein